MAIQTIDINVAGMTCGHCEMTVNKAVKTLDGIIDVRADKNGGLATVIYDDTKVTPEQIKNAINATEIYSAA